MSIITIQECESTNTTLKEMLAGNRWYPNGTVLRAVTQTKGRGQRGNSWEAEPGMNVTMSIVLRPGPIDRHSHFLVSEAIAVAVARYLMQEGITDPHRVEVKWPNDILVDGRKIAGILIENALSASGELLYSVAGLGLNVNQTLFSDAAPGAVSMSEITGRYYDLDEVTASLTDIITTLSDRIAPILLLQENSRLRINEISRSYHDLLWRKEGIHKWRDAETDEIFTATIDHVEDNGLLNLIEPESGRRREYFFKEVFPHHNG